MSSYFHSLIIRKLAIGILFQIFAYRCESQSPKQQPLLFLFWLAAHTSAANTCSYSYCIEWKHWLLPVVSLYLFLNRYNHLWLKKSISSLVCPEMKFTILFYDRKGSSIYKQLIFIIVLPDWYHCKNVIFLLHLFYDAVNALPFIAQLHYNSCVFVGSMHARSALNWFANCTGKYLKFVIHKNIFHNWMKW